jgi:hypothetical protein
MEFLSQKNMKKLAPLFILPLVFMGCGPTEAPDEAGAAAFPDEYVISIEDDGEGLTGMELSGEEGVSVESDADGDLASCREQNAEISLQLEAAEKKLLTCQENLSDAQESSSKSTGYTVKESQLQLIREAILTSDQPEYPFECGRMANYFRENWFDTFSEELIKAQIRFSNGFVEAEDLFGGCHSDQGQMAFFLGAERDDDLEFHLIKYDIAEKTLEPALMFDGSDEAVVTKFGKRYGPYISFPADDGRVFRYYYDANIVAEKQE